MESETPAPSAPVPPSAARPDDQDPRGSLRHVLVDSAPPIPPQGPPSVSYQADHQPPLRRTQTPPPPPTPTAASASESMLPGATPTLDGAQAAQGPQGGPQNLAAITYTLRKNANGGVSTVYSGSKIKYLKKDDGLPFWRRDIQYAFLYYVFQDKTRVFTKLSNGSKGHTFAETYVDAMANSSKCSQILKEKLLADTSDQALDMAMVCLLVNVGRMNTTVNFFPEMRARVRTFHSIPCLQTHQSPQAYKQLQDGPRLKSILKGAMEDTPQPNNLEELANHNKPRTNPVSLIFVLAQYAPRISDLHFPAGIDFFDLFMRDTLSSKSRATALLWIIWWYLESDFTAEDALRNPFGTGQPSNASDAMIEGLNVMKGVQMRVPEFEILTEEQAANENLDPADEIEYGEAKKVEREAILASDASPAMFPQKRASRNVDMQTPYSNSIVVDDSPSTTLTEPHHSHRFRNYSSSPTRSGDTRGRLTPTSDFVVAHDEHASRPLMPDRDRTQSGTPAPTIERQSSNGNFIYHQHGKGTPEGEARKGPGRGNYPRRIKAHSTQPFEQMYHAEQFKGPSDTSRNRRLFHFGSEPNSSVLPSNGSVPILASQNGTHATPPAPTSHAGYYPLNGHAPFQQPLPPQTAAPAPPPTEQPASTPNEQPPPTKRGRHAERHRAVEQTRHDRISTIVDSTILAIRKEKHRERKRRGVVFDAWVKARALHLADDLWRSDDEVESFERCGGLDDVRDDGIELSVSVPGHTGFEQKKVQWNPGDVGLLAGSLAKTWRNLARANGVEEIVDRSRRRTRGAEKEKERRGGIRGGDADEHTKAEVDATDDLDHADQPGSGRARRHSPMSYPTSNFKRKVPLLAPADRLDMSPADAADDDAASIATDPMPKKRRRAGPRRMKGAGSRTAAPTDDQEDAQRGQPRGPRGGRRPGTGARRGKRKSLGSGTGRTGSTSREPKVTASSQPDGSFSWVVDGEEKTRAESKGRLAAKEATDDVKEPEGNVEVDTEAAERAQTAEEDEKMVGGDETAGQGRGLADAVLLADADDA